MFGNISFNLLPVTFVITDTFAGRADGQHASKRVDVFARGGKAFDQLFAFPFHLFLLADVAGDGRSADDFSAGVFYRRDGHGDWNDFSVLALAFGFMRAE